MRVLPAHPSREHLRKQAKRLGRERALRLADAQRVLASEYGFGTWTDLMREVARASGDRGGAAALLSAVRAGDVARVRMLLAGGANPNVGDGRETPLHAAARRGPLTLVEALIAGGALEWQPDAQGRTPSDAARRGRPRDRPAILALLDRTTIADPSFRAAVAAIANGDAARLATLLDAEPRLLRERILGPEAYRAAQRYQYFLDPKLFWFVANNPTLVKRMPPNIAEVARVMLDRGVDPADLDYTLELVMTGSAAREQGHQVPLMREIMAAGGRPTPQALRGAAAYREREALRALLEAGVPLDAPLAAALGEDAALQQLLATADRTDVQAAFGLAVINGEVPAARLALAAGADVNARLPVHVHSTPLHQAAAGDRADLVELLLAHGAKRDARDALWEATPLDWAIYLKRERARAALERTQS